MVGCCLCWVWRHVGKATLWTEAGCNWYWVWDSLAKGHSKACCCLPAVCNSQPLKASGGIWIGSGRVSGSDLDGENGVHQVNADSSLAALGEGSHTKGGTYLLAMWKEGSTQGQWQLSLLYSPRSHTTQFLFVCLWHSLSCCPSIGAQGKGSNAWKWVCMGL